MVPAAVAYPGGRGEGGSPSVARAWIRTRRSVRGIVSRVVGREASLWCSPPWMAFRWGPRGPSIVVRPQHGGTLDVGLSNSFPSSTVVSYVFLMVPRRLVSRVGRSTAVPAHRNQSGPVNSVRVGGMNGVFRSRKGVVVAGGVGAVSLIAPGLDIRSSRVSRQRGAYGRELLALGGGCSHHLEAV